MIITNLTNDAVLVKFFFNICENEKDKICETEIWKTWFCIKIS